ncbi:hypothetical protein [Tenacibaculum sp. M341]|uniref:hypothetical protein n=1 Tax=Tenacibaculum sp. M341 TaxID=2530339 RepID=UPI0010451902|nr:hypothetical protein [Tenacibaculum sp. M341]TCI92760.1 hypothetical protein EYW44_07640 [Tenacibaculum sp. M341]
MQQLNSWLFFYSNSINPLFNLGGFFYDAMKEDIVFYQNKATRISMGVLFGILFLFFLCLSIFFIEGTYRGFDKPNSLLFYLFFYSLFLIPTFFFGFVSYNYLKNNKIEACSLSKRKLSIFEVRRHLSRRNESLEISTIKSVTTKKLFFNDVGLIIKLKNGRIHPTTLNMLLSKKDKIRLCKEINKRINP